MSDEENSGVFSRRKDYERRVPVATIPLPEIQWAQRARSLLSLRMKLRTYLKMDFSTVILRKIARICLFEIGSDVLFVF